MKTKSAIYRFFLMGLLFALFFNCKKKEDIKTAPTVTISAITNITATSATTGGDVTSDGGATVTAKGICYGTNHNPTTSDSKTTSGTGTGSFTSSITGLNPGNTYYIRAYATNSVGTGYSSQLSFTTLALAPTLTTTISTSVTSVSAISGGNITNDGGSAVTARGVCWAITQNPTTANSKTTDGSGTGTFNSSLSGLLENTTYYLRAYAINSSGPAYGNELSFKTSASAYGTVTDIDGNIYHYITIGTQAWMTENLKTTKYRNGDPIPNVTVNNSWSALVTGAYCWYYNSTAYKVGGLYNWYAVVDSRSIAPTGWHVPSDAEWSTLIMYLGGESVAGGKLKEQGLAHWNSPNYGATNSVGFVALPGGQRTRIGEFFFEGYWGYWWSSTETANSFGIFLYILNDDSKAVELAGYKQEGLSVRCLRD